MKIKKIIILSLFFTMIFSAAASELSFSFDAGLESGIPFYGDSDVNKINSIINEDSGHRVIIGALADINLKIEKYLTCFFGTDLLFDFNWSGEDYFNHIDLAFFPGIKIFPNVGGLNFSFAYVLGKRFDFYSVSPSLISGADSKYDSAAWGNGIRLGLEYNFYYKTRRKFLPSIGAYWRWIPRGNYNKDNVISVYALLNF